MLGILPRAFESNRDFAKEAQNLDSPTLLSPTAEALSSTFERSHHASRVVVNEW